MSRRLGEFVAARAHVGNGSGPAAPGRAGVRTVGGVEVSRAEAIAPLTAQIYF